MWIRRKTYNWLFDNSVKLCDLENEKMLIADIQRDANNQIEEKDAEIAKLKTMIPRKTLLTTFPLEELRKIAVEEYGLNIDHFDKLDIIKDILQIEIQMRAFTDKNPCKKGV